MKLSSPTKLSSPKSPSKGYSDEIKFPHQVRLGFILMKLSSPTKLD
jgi:hypothetical protein